MTAVPPVPELDVRVIGAGQAGLATGYHLGLTGLRSFGWSQVLPAGEPAAARGSRSSAVWPGAFDHLR